MKWLGVLAAALLVVACAYVSLRPRVEPSLDVTLAWLGEHQNPDGSWGDVPAPAGTRSIGRTGVTSLALLAFLDSNYSHLSKERLGGRVIQDVVRSGFLWLKNDMGEDGRFASGADADLDQALAATAFAEAYGLTGSPLFKDDAQKALEALEKSEGADGAWSSSEATAAACLAFRSAELSDLPFNPQVYARIGAHFDARGAAVADSAEMILRMSATRGKGHPSLAPAAARLVTQGPDPYQPDYFAWKRATLALAMYDGYSGRDWRRWSEAVHDVLLRAQAPDGSWPGSTLSETVARSSLALSSLQIYRQGLYATDRQKPKKRFLGW